MHLLISKRFSTALPKDPVPPVIDKISEEEIMDN